MAGSPVRPAAEMVTGTKVLIKEINRLKSPFVLFCAVIPAAFAGITAIGPELDIGVLALCTDGFVMLHADGLGFLIHED
jgi:hypothetical protein